jgi:PIN domain nuclease of toxin-antitoxin system
MLLDTHVWVWGAADEESRLGRRTRRLLGQAGRRHQLRLSPASIFELAALHTAGRIRLARPVEQWIRESIEHGGLRLAELTTSIAVDGGSIPSAALPDPIDRLLVATARALDAPLVTRDRRILEYAARTRHLRIINAAT